MPTQPTQESYLSAKINTTHQKRGGKFNDWALIKQRIEESISEEVKNIGEDIREGSTLDIAIKEEAGVVIRNNDKSNF